VQQIKAVIADVLHPNLCLTRTDKGGRSAAAASKQGAVIGTGYSKTELSSTIFNHVNKVMECVHKLVGDDAVKAPQLSDRVQQRARGTINDESIHDKKYTKMCVGVFESVKSFLHELSSRYKTKAPNDVRHVMQTVITALMSHFDVTSHRYLARKLDIDRKWLVDGAARALTFYEEGLLDSIAESRRPSTATGFQMFGDSFVMTTGRLIVGLVKRCVTNSGTLKIVVIRSFTPYIIGRIRLGSCTRTV
jgi:hypothetical protein